MERKATNVMGNSRTFELLAIREHADADEIEVEGHLSIDEIAAGSCISVQLGDGLYLYAPIKGARASEPARRTDAVTLMLDVPEPKTREDWLALCAPGDVLLLDVMPEQSEGSDILERNPYDAPASLEGVRSIRVWPSLLITYASALLALVVSYLVGERLYYGNSNVDLRILQVVLPQLMLLAVLPAVISTCFRPRSTWRAVLRGLLLGPVTFVGMYLLYPYVHRWLG